MGEIESQFNATFARWKIRLPPEDIANRRLGKIVQAGWAIWYLFGSNEHGEYLDYYSSHRMTSDEHIRIYIDGRCESLPAIREFRILSRDPKEDALRKAEFHAENGRIAEMLDAKGFGLQGDEPGGVQINRFLHVNKADESDEGMMPRERNRYEKK